MQLPYGIVTTTTTAERTNEKGMLPSPCKWGDAAHEKNKTKLKQGWCVVSEKTGTLSPRLKVLPYGWKKTRRFFFLSFFFVYLFDWKSPPRFLFGLQTTHRNKTEKFQTIPTDTHSPVSSSFSFFFILSWSRHPFVFESHLVVICYTAMQSIRFHSTTKHKKQTKKERKKRRLFFSLILCLAAIAPNFHEFLIFLTPTLNGVLSCWRIFQPNRETNADFS